MGQSFAIPTKAHNVRDTLPLAHIQLYVDGFIMSAEQAPDSRYQITAIGCGLAGLRHEDIAPMFEKAPQNCLFDTEWAPFLPEGTTFWGTF